MGKVSVRYIVSDVASAIRFYTEHLQFKVAMNPAPGFAALDRDDLRLLLNAPGAGGAGASMPDGSKPEPGGWNRFQVQVPDLTATVEELKKKGVHFRSEIIEGLGGRQILLDDPSGNPIELFQSTRQ
jgi:catechol 2,3-dioxygenase-like lactoylglutathione lyase family enzyme